MTTSKRTRRGAVILVGAALFVSACEGDPQRTPGEDPAVPGAPGSITPDLDREPRPVLRDTVRQEQLQVDTLEPPPPAPLD